MFLGGTMAPRRCARWSASPLDLLAENQPGTRLDGIPQLCFANLRHCKVADMLKPRSDFSAAVINGRLMVIGGVLR